MTTNNEPRSVRATLEAIDTAINAALNIQTGLRQASVDRTLAVSDAAHCLVRLDKAIEELRRVGALVTDGALRQRGKAEGD